MNTDNKNLYIVHAVDTEGPLRQSDKATLLRINELFGTSFDTNAHPRQLAEIIAKVLAKAIDLSGREEEVSHFVSTTQFLFSKKDYAAAIDEVTCPEFRTTHADPQGGPYRFSWFILDNVATLMNPRRRLFGYGQVYVNLVEALNPEYPDLDGRYLHYHQMAKDQHPFTKETNFHASDEYNQILCRNIIEHRQFPAAYRAGYCLERWCANLWLENWIPFDFSNHAPSFDFPVERRVGEELDFWLRAPNDWSHYHPDSHDYEKPGNLRRTIFRSLCYRTRLYVLEQSDVEQAFARAASGQPTVLSTFSHDFRRLQPEADGFYEMVRQAADKYPEVKWHNATSVEAACGVLGYEKQAPLELKVWVDGGMVWASSNHDVFGSEPFLALKTVDHRFFHQNFVKVEDNLWAYHLRYPQTIDMIGIGSCDKTGSMATAVIRQKNGKFEEVQGSGYWSGSPE